MLANASIGQSDPRVMYGILTKTTLEYLRGSHQSEHLRDAYLNNLLKLLDMYRFDSLKDQNPRGILERREIPFHRTEYIENNGEDTIIDAMSIAHEKIYPGIDKDLLVEKLTLLLESVRTQDIETVDQHELQLLRDFLIAIQENL